MDAEKISEYKIAFEKFSGVSPGQYETRLKWGQGPLLVKFRDSIFRIESDADMFRNLKESLTKKESAAINIPLTYWIEAVDDVHILPEFIERLLANIDEKDEIIKLNTALNLSGHASQSASVFWETIYILDPVELYPKSIVAASLSCDINALIERLMEEMISDGENAFNQIRGGTFEYVCCDDGEEAEENAYYIYNVDPYYWECD